MKEYFKPRIMEKDYNEEALKELLSRAPKTSRLFETWKKRTMWSGGNQTEAFMEFYGYVDSKDPLLASSITLEIKEAEVEYAMETLVLASTTATLKVVAELLEAVLKKELEKAN